MLVMRAGVTHSNGDFTLGLRLVYKMRPDVAEHLLENSSFPLLTGDIARDESFDLSFDSRGNFC